jgi:hypothetical protein
MQPHWQCLWCRKSAMNFLEYTVHLRMESIKQSNTERISGIFYQFLSPLLNVYVDLQTMTKHEEETAPRM